MPIDRAHIIPRVAIMGSIIFERRLRLPPCLLETEILDELNVLGLIVLSEIVSSFEATLLRFDVQS